jgi:hypothetical protein
MSRYNRSHWYWAVGGSTTQVYSSASSSYVPIADATYAAWLVAGNTPTRITADDMLLLRIDILESSVTERMKQEAAAGSSNTFASGPYTGKTAAQAIAEIVAAKDALRAQFT